MNIRTECYLAILKKCKKQYPDAHFEVITRTAKSVLSPSKDLLIKAKAERMDFEVYRELYIGEVFNNLDALRRIHELKKIAKDKLVFLICYEKDASECHRSIVKELILNLKISV